MCSQTRPQLLPWSIPVSVLLRSCEWVRKPAFWTLFRLGMPTWRTLAVSFPEDRSMSLIMSVDWRSVNSIVWRRGSQARRKNPLSLDSLSALFTVLTLPHLPPVEGYAAFEGLIVCLSRLQFGCDRICYPNVISVRRGNGRRPQLCQFPCW